MAFQAQYPSACGRCDYGIKVGQAAESVPGTPGEYQHVTCPTPPLVCFICFMEMARDGSHDCEEDR